jgi:hypothetical protein
MNKDIPNEDELQRHPQRAVLAALDVQLEILGRALAADAYPRVHQHREPSWKCRTCSAYFVLRRARDLDEAVADYINAVDAEDFDREDFF